MASDGMNIIRSEGHEIYGMHLNKISLSPFDTKRWICDDGIHTKAYEMLRNAYEMLTLTYYDELIELDAEILKLLVG